MINAFKSFKIIALTGIQKPRKVLTGRSVFLSGFCVCEGLIFIAYEETD